MYISTLCYQTRPSLHLNGIRMCIKPIKIHPITLYKTLLGVLKWDIDVSPLEKLRACGIIRVLRDHMGIS